MRATILASLVLLAFVVKPTSAADYVFGVVPQRTPLNLANEWIPLLQFLGKRCSITLRFRTAPTIEAFAGAVEDGKYDFAFMNPLQYVTAGRTGGFRAFARPDRDLSGIIVTKIDSGISDIAELNGNKVGFPSPSAFAASVLTRSYLEENGVVHKVVYFRSHDSVYEAILAGVVSTGGGVIRTWQALPEVKRSQLKIIATTQPQVSHALAARRSVAQHHALCLADNLTAVDPSEKLQELIANLNLSGIIAASDSDYDTVPRHRGFELNKGADE